MCGICGIHDPDGDPRERARRVRVMAAAMAHRGPDDEGFFDDDTVSLGFRRLAVIDLETGQQPIRLEGDRAVIVLNGEIYNFRELRSELAARHPFRTRGDVEVALTLWAEQGAAALARLNGMFATAIWDRERRTLSLARDRFGIKPLFVCREGRAVAFASELAALLAAGFPADRTLSLAELRHFLAFKYPSPAGTILEHVQPLHPGDVLQVSRQGSVQRSYLSAPSSDVQTPAPRDLAARTRELLEAAVRRQLVADVPLGVFLSGGLDSSTVATLASRASGERVRTFAVGFTGPGAVSELPAAREVADALHSEHAEIVMDPQEVRRDLEAILGRLDGPLGDATAVPTWYMSRLARQHATVALSGEGADEVFGGYPRQRYDVWLDRLGAAGRRALPVAMRLAGRRPSDRLRQRLLMASSLERQLDWGRVFLPAEIDALAERTLPGEAALGVLHAPTAARWREAAAADALNARLLADLELFLPGDLLPKVDRMSMAHSLEVRVPYLDNELVAFLGTVPGRLKVGHRQGKLLLRQAVSGLLPRAAVHRRKQGFDVPVGAWLRGPLRGPLEDALSPGAVRHRGLFRPAVVERLLQEHQARARDHGEKLWCLLALELWMQGTLDRPPGARP
jgi:asparagine synthase (glutamine-hydrolysing)